MAKWTEEAEAADWARNDDPTAMDIYDVDAAPGRHTLIALLRVFRAEVYSQVPTRREVQAMLGEEELADGEDSLGAADWIATGLRIEEMKYVQLLICITGFHSHGDCIRLAVAYTARQAAHTSGAQTRLSLVQQRQKLATAIRAFHTVGRAHIAELLPGEGGSLGSEVTDLGAQWDDATDVGPADDNELPGDQPEAHPHGLPSTFGMRRLIDHNLGDLARKERKLREGQMNDAL